MVSKNAIADFIYLDSANERHYILKEFKLACQLVDMGSIICIDDYRAEKCVLVEEYLKSVDIPYTHDDFTGFDKMYLKITPHVIDEIQTSFNDFYNRYDWKKLDIEFRENQPEYEHAMSYVNIGVDK